MTTRNIGIFFGPDHSGTSDRVTVDNLLDTDTLTGNFFAPPNDTAFRLGVTHQSGFPETARNFTLTDQQGAVKWQGSGMACDLRMRTADPGERGYDMRLNPGEAYKLTVSCVEHSGRRVDCFFSPSNK